MPVMMAALMTASALFGAGAVYLFHRHKTKLLRAEIQALRAGTIAPRMETMKKIVWTCLVNGFLWIWCSYILAWFDRVQIAESLSTAAVTQIIGVVLAYCIKSAVENLSKNNHWPDKKNSPESDESEPAG